MGSKFIRREFRPWDRHAQVVGRDGVSWLGESGGATRCGRPPERELPAVGHSYRSACIGSTLAARRAGM